MTRGRAVVGSALFLVVAPCMVAGVVPWWVSRWEFHGRWAMPWLGGVLVVLGSIGVLDSFRRFALEGLGTPAPVAPTQHLVAGGLYRWVRNPMYVGVVTAIAGQALVFGDGRLLLYGACVALGFHLFVVGYEEPALRRTFGSSYRVYCAAVPRWIPRLRPWRSAGGG